MKKILSLVLALAMALSLCSFAAAEGFDGEIKIWVAEATVEFTKAQVEAFKAANPEYAGMTVVVEPVGEGDAASNMLTDVEAGADIFGFAQDQWPVWWPLALWKSFWTRTLRSSRPRTTAAPCPLLCWATPCTPTP